MYKNIARSIMNLILYKNYNNNNIDDPSIRFITVQPIQFFQRL